MIWNTLYLLHDVDDATITEAIGQGFGVPAGSIIVEDSTSQAVLPEQVVLVHRDDYRAREPETEFPVELTISVPSGIRLAPRPDVDRLAIMASTLRVPFMASLDDDDQDTMRLVMPDGVPVPRELGDVDVVLTAADRECLDRYRRPAPARAA
jgi:hypothetical protein